MVRPELRARLLAVLPLALAAALLIVHSLRFGFVTDDAYISFVYARNLAEHGALVFNPGLPPPVEGYTNFLWTALLGLAALLGLPLEPVALVLGTGFAIATMVVAHRLVTALAPGPWPAVAPALLASSAGYACWASGGLETQLFAFLVLTAVHLATVAPRGVRHVGWVLALAAMTRPEGLLVAAVIGLHRLVGNLAARRLRPSRDELWALGGFLLVWAPWFAWRWSYYGWPLPNTAYVKAAGPAAPGYEAKMRAAGLHYLGQWARHAALLALGPLALVGLGAAWPRSPHGRFGTLAVALVVSYVVYTVAVGGDFMGLHRFVLPVLPLVAIGAALGLATLVGRLPAGRPRAVGAAVAIAALLIGHGVHQERIGRAAMRPGNWASDRGIDTPAFLAVYAHDRALIGRAMKACFRPGDFAIYGGAGAKPYFAELPGIDVFGLVSDRIAHEVPRSRPRPGHNKWAPDALLLEYAPTFVFSCYRLHRGPSRPPLPCDERAWARRGYDPVTLRVPGLREQGEYYSFLVARARGFECPGLVR